MSQKHLHRAFFIALISLSISACGIRPKTLDAPPGAENTLFPQTYPKNGPLDPVFPQTPVK